MPATDRDRGARRLEAALRELASPPEVTVGVHADTGAQEHRGESTATVATVAGVTEFGSPTAPPRSYLRATVDAQRTSIERSLSDAAQRAVRGAIAGSGTGHVERELGRAAARLARAVRGSLRQLGLHGTGHLEESIEARVGGRVVQGGR